MAALLGILGIILGIAMLFTDFGVGLVMIFVGGIFIWAEVETTKDNQMRHQNDYGKAPQCYICGSTKTYYMTYDDKREDIAFWGAASTKIGKRYHCDCCGNEW